MPKNKRVNLSPIAIMKGKVGYYWCCAPTNANNRFVSPSIDCSYNREYFTEAEVECMSFFD